VKKALLAAIVCMAMVSCETPEGGVVNKVMMDWGLKARPEGYTSEADKVFQRLGGVGATEMKRMNAELEHGQVKFQQMTDLKGKYYKEAKVYESFYPVDVASVTRSGENETGFDGFIEYAYRIYQSARKSTTVEAEAETASIPTDTVGRDLFRYHFGPTGEWNGAKGEKSKR
jgi:hypothetical protein